MLSASAPFVRSAPSAAPSSSRSRANARIRARVGRRLDREEIVSHSVRDRGVRLRAGLSIRAES
jgi:hypothetical protein